jgi:S-disulfanyl-L-cysteine oxidoreductase SoxD
MRSFTITHSKPGASTRKGGFVMFLHKRIMVGAIATASLAFSAFAHDFGRPATQEEIQLWDIDVRPDGKGLPAGSGTVAYGKTVYELNCMACHGANGKDGIKDRLAGGLGTLASDKPIKTVGSYWPYATTLFDYIRRAMPYQAPGSLSINDTYAVTAYVLSLSGIVSQDEKLDKDTLPKIQMPNRDGFIPEPEFQKITNSR